MYCANCGKEIDDKAAICVGCGVPTSNQTQQASYQPQSIPTINIVNTNTNTNVAGAIHPTKSKMVTLLLCIFLGVFGIHRFYVGKIGTGILYLCTLGFGGFGCLIDAIVILLGGFRDKWGYPLT